MSAITCWPSAGSVKETCDDNSNAGWQQTKATYGRADQFAHRVPAGRLRAAFRP